MGVITVFWPFFVQSPAWRFPQCCLGHKLMLCPGDSLTQRLGPSTGCWPGVHKVLRSISSTIKEKHVQNWIGSRDSQALGRWDFHCLCLQNVKRVSQGKRGKYAWEGHSGDSWERHSGNSKVFHLRKPKAQALGGHSSSVPSPSQTWWCPGHVVKMGWLLSL